MPRSTKPRRPHRPYRPTAIRLAARPWKLVAVFAPVERVLARIEIDGTVDAAQGRPVFREDMKGGWYETVPALRGVIEFHERAAARHGLPVDLQPLSRLANKLDLDTPLFEADITAARACIAACKRQAAQLTEDQAEAILTTIRIGIQLEKAA